MQVLERIREESQLVEALCNLPRDLDELYTRFLESIANEDRLFVRQTLLWIEGHANAGRLKDNGIHIDVLVSAVCDDLRHMTGRSYRYTAEDVKSLCGFLITVSNSPLPFTEFLSEIHVTPTNGDNWHIYRPFNDDQGKPNGSFVTIAHYTVMEFLASERIAASSVRHFALSSGEIGDEFDESVLRQALAADPAGTSVDWVREREPYCLTLVPLIAVRLNAKNPRVLDRWTAYFQPTSPHFPRIGRIQLYLATGCLPAQSFYMAQLPVRHSALPPSTYQGNSPEALALLGMVVTNNRGLAEAFSRRMGWDGEAARGQQVVASFLDGCEWGPAILRTYQGTVHDLAKMRGHSL
jgi:hypothetical protein